MPGVNCPIVGYNTSRRTKGTDIFKLPAAKNDKYKKWREEWLYEIAKTRVIDKTFREKILNDTVYTWEKNVKAEDIESCKYTLILSLSLSFWTVFSGLAVVGWNNHQHIQQKNKTWHIKIYPT